MGTGLYKLANTNTCVETQYQSVYDIPIMDYNREMKNLEELKGKKILFFTAASQNKRAEHFIQSILSKKSELEELNIELVALTTNTYNHENTTFDEQKSYYNTFGIELNGPQAHPLVKFLKRGSQIFSYETLDAPNLHNDLNMFLVDGNGKDSYYFQRKAGIDRVIESRDSCFEELRKSIDGLLNKV